MSAPGMGGLGITDEGAEWGCPSLFARETGATVTLGLPLPQGPTEFPLSPLGLLGQLLSLHGLFR